MKGLCHYCNGSNLETKLSEKGLLPVCRDCNFRGCY